jgi:hypothetical protein
MIEYPTKLSGVQFESYVESCIKSGSQRLSLSHWRFNVEYVKKIDPYLRGKKSSNDEVTFEILIDQMYMEATVYVSAYAFSMFYEGKRDYVRQDIYHELSHILTDPLAEMARSHIPKADKDRLLFLEENLTQRITMLL